MSDRIRLDGTTLNAPDALALAEFYAELTGGVASGASGWATVAGPDASLGFQRVDDFRAPTWPGGPVPMQIHLDFFVDDLEATGARASAAGATLLDDQPNADHCLVFADPAGHPFCLSTWSTEMLTPMLSGGAADPVSEAPRTRPAADSPAGDGQHDEGCVRPGRPGASPRC